MRGMTGKVFICIAEYVFGVMSPTSCEAAPQESVVCC